MGRFTGPKNKIARRFGVDIGLKSNPTKVAKRLNQQPGVHGPKKHANSSLSGYGKQLIEKQKAKYTYGVREKQFSRYVSQATGMAGDSGVNLQRLLELRLDNVIYRMGFADTRAQARQLVSHGMFVLNGQNFNIPSHFVKVGDVITLKANKIGKKYFTDISDKLSKKETQGWLMVDSAKKSGKVLNLPTDKDFDKIFDVKFIIEYYSSR